MDYSAVAGEVIDGAIAAAPAEEGIHFEYTRSLIRASLADPHGAFAAVDSFATVNPKQAAALRSYFSGLFPSWTFWPATDSRRQGLERLTPLLDRTCAKQLPPVEPFRLAIQKSATRLQAARKRLLDRFGETDWLVPDLSRLLPDGPVDVPVNEEFSGIGIQHVCRQEWTRLTWLCFLAGLDRVALPREIHGRDDHVQLQMVGWARVFLAFGVDDPRERIATMLENSDVATPANHEAVVDVIMELAAATDWFGTKIADVEEILDADFLHQDELVFLGVLKFFQNQNEDLFGEEEEEEEDEEDEGER